MKGLRKILHDRGLKHSWLANQLGIDKPKMSRLINGKQKASVSEIFMICHLLECEKDDLYT